MSDSTQFTDEDVREHVGDIMFDPSEAPDPECSLCQRGIETGAWAFYGVDDPFAPDEDG